MIHIINKNNIFIQLLFFRHKEVGNYMNIFSHLLYLCGITYLVIGLIMLFKDRKSALNRAFFALNLCLFLWSISFALLTDSSDKASCMLWSTLASLGYCTFASISIHFFLLYAKKNVLLKKWWIYVVLYLPAAIFFIQSLRHDLFVSDFIHNQFGWILVTNVGSIWFVLFMATLVISGTLNIYLCYSMFREAASIREQKKTKIILLSALFSFSFSMLLVSLTKIFINVEIPDVTVVGLMTWLLGILYAILKYQLMTLTPTLAAKSILQTIVDSVILVNPQGLITYVNPDTLTLLEYEETDLLEKPIEILFPMDIRSEMEDIIHTLSNAPIRNKDISFVSKNNAKIPILFSAAECKENDGTYLGYVALSRDITEYKHREEEIKFLSYHDQLTGLYNRRFYEEELKRLDTKRNLPISIIMSDVNGLKIINDSIGHVMGDELLKKVSQAISNGCRADDIIARLGGDEFVILLPKTDHSQVEQIIGRINELLKIEKVGNLDISVSFGFEVKNEEQEDIRDITKNAEDKMYKHKLLNSSSTRKNTIDLIMNALYEKNNREMLHSKRVGELCEAIALNMNFEKETVYRIKIAGLMHDIGKIGIDDKMLNKPDKLDADEWAIMKKHPEIGQRILSAASEFSEIGDYIFEHQEKWDGTGYPRGLKGNAILLQARIIAVADSYDAMTSHRNYGKVFSEEEAVNEIERCSGTQFDPAIAKIFVEKVLGKKWASLPSD